MLSYTVHCEIDDKLTTQYRTLNGAPDFKQSTNEEGNILLDVAMKDIEQTEPDLWYNSMQQTPTTLLYITNSQMKKVHLHTQKYQEKRAATQSRRGFHTGRRLGIHKTSDTV